MIPFCHTIGKARKVAGAIRRVARHGIRQRLQHHNFCTVTHTQAGENLAVAVAALIHIARTDAHSGDQIANLQRIQTGVILHDIAIDEHAGRSGGIGHIDHVDHTLGVVNIRHLAINPDEVADAGIVHRRAAGYVRRLHIIERIRNHPDAAVILAAKIQLHLAAIVGNSAVALHMHTDAVVTGDGEYVDAVSILILDIDTVEEGGIRIIIRCIGGHIALNGELHAALLLRHHLDLGDRGDGLLIGAGQLTQNIEHNEAIGIALVILDVIVREEGAAGSNEPAAAGKLLIGHDVDLAHRSSHRIFLIAANIGGAGEVIRVACAPGALIAHNQRCNRLLRTLLNQNRCCIIELEAGLILLSGRCAEGIGGRISALHKAMVGVEIPDGGEIDAVGFVGAEGVVHDNAIGRADIRTDRLQQAIGQRCTIERTLRALAVGLGGDNQVAALGCILRQSRQLLRRIGRGREVAAVEGHRQNDHRIIFQLLVGEGALLNIFRADAIFGAERNEVAHIIRVAAGDIEIAMTIVDADLDQLVRGVHLVRHGSLALELLTVIDTIEGNGHHLGALERALQIEYKGFRLACGNHGSGIDGLDDRLRSARIQGHNGSGQRIIQRCGIRHGRRNALRLSDNRQRHVGSHTCRDGRRQTNPDRRSDRQVAIGLRHLQVVIRIRVIQLNIQLIGGGCGRNGIERQAILTDDLQLAQRFAIRVGEACRDVNRLQLTVINDGAKQLIVQVVIDLQILVFRRIEATGCKCLIDSGLCKIVGQNDIAAGVGVAPFALVVILVIGGRDMPALGQRQIILGVAGEIATAANLTLAVANLNQIQNRIAIGGIAGKIVEIAEGRAGVVKLGNNRRLGNILRLHALCNRCSVFIQAVVGIVHQVVIVMHTGIAVGLVVDGAVVARDRAIGIEGVGVAGATRPGHLIAIDGNEIAGGIPGRRFSGLLPLGLAAIGSLAQGGKVIVAGRGCSARGVEIVGMIRNRQEIDILRRHRVLIGILQRADTIGVFAGMGVKLAEIEGHAALAHVEGPGLFHSLAILAGELEGDGMLAVAHIALRLPVDGFALRLRRHRSTIDRHIAGGRLALIGHTNRNDRTLVRAGGAVGCGCDADNHRLIQNRHGFAGRILHTIFVLRCGPQRKAALSLEGRCRNGIGVGSALHRIGRQGGQLATIDRVAHGHGADFRAVVEHCREAVVQIHIGLRRDKLDFGVKHIAQLMGILHGKELHGKELVGVLFVGPAGEGLVIELNADLAAVVGCLLVVDDITAVHRAERPLGVVALRVAEEQQLLVGAIRLVVGGTQELSAIFEGVIGAVEMDIENHGTIAGFQRTVVCQHGGHRVGCVAVIRAHAGRAGMIVDDDLVAIGRGIAGHCRCRFCRHGKRRQHCENHHQCKQHRNGSPAHFSHVYPPFMPSAQRTEPHMNDMLIIAQFFRNCYR